jgi:preprotein translocase subunit YajC
MFAFLYLALLVVAFFILIVLPQRRRMAAQRALIASIEPGDEVITTGGIFGTVRSTDDVSVELEIADGVVVKVARGAIGQRVGPDPVADTDTLADDAQHDDDEHLS